jgi:hypothetical protein
MISMFYAKWFNPVFHTSLSAFKELFATSLQVSIHKADTLGFN